MNKLALLLSSIIILASCQKSEINPLKFEHPDWVRLEIPGGREAYSIVGDIDKELLVAADTRIYYSNDGGKNWTISADFSTLNMTLQDLKDTVFVYTATHSIDEKTYGSICEYYSIDFGKTWNRYVFDFTNRNHLKGFAESVSGTSYHIKNSCTADTSFKPCYVRPSILEKHNGYQWDIMDFPQTHLFHDLHLDTRNRLYLCASSGEITEQNRVQGTNIGDPAFVYVSRKELP